MTTPEARARTNIDALLSAFGWVVQNRVAKGAYAEKKAYAVRPNQIRRIGLNQTGPTNRGYSGAI